MPPLLQATNTPFLRYHRLDPSALQRLYAREAAELLTLTALEGPDVFVQACMDQLRALWLAVCPGMPSTTTLDDLCAMPAAEVGSSARGEDAEGRAKHGLNVAAAAFVPQAVAGDSPRLPFPSADPPLPLPLGGSPGVHFYQAADGHHVFLANISRKMLQMVG